MRINENEIYKSEIAPLVNKIATDDDHQEAIFRFVQDKNLPVTALNDNYKQIIAEEIVADYTANILADYNIDYGLDKNIIDNLKKSILKITEPIVTTNEVENIGVEKTAKVLETIPQKDIPVKTKFHKAVDSMERNFVNKGYAIDKLAESTGNKELKYKFDKTLSSQAEGQYVIGNAQTDNKGNEIGKSIIEIWKPIEQSGKEQEFSKYLLHKHNVSRMNLENPELVKNAIDEYNQFVLEYPEIAKAPEWELKQWEKENSTVGELAKGHRELIDNVIRLKGIKNKPVFGDEVTADISKKKVVEFEGNNPEFIEWSKDIKTFNDNNMKNMVEAGLSSQETANLLNEMYPDYVRMQRDRKNNNQIVHYNKNSIKVNNQIQKAKGGNQDILPLKYAMAQQTMNIKSAIRRNDLGLELYKTIGGEKSNNIVLSNPYNDNEYKLTVYENGKPLDVQLNEELYKAIKPTEKWDFESNPFFKIVQSITKMQRAILTDKDPLFALYKNPIKDLQDGLFDSKYTGKFVKNYPKALKYMKENNSLWKQYLALGGNQNSFFEHDTGIKKEASKIGKTGEKISSISNVIEQAPRFTELLSTLESGGSITEAMYNAADVTVNFKRGGDVTKTINRNGFNFLNASVQGFDKFIRNIKGDNGTKGMAKSVLKLLFKASLFSIAPKLILELLWGDDEDYNDITEREKDAYWIVGKTSDGKFIKVPEGRTQSVFSSIARRAMNYCRGDKDAFDGLGEFLIDQVAPINPLDNSVIEPILQVGNNKSWYGTEIVPKRLQDKLPKDQYDESTDEISKFLGEKLNISPKQINYVLKQYSGDWGKIALAPLTPKAETNPISSLFTIDSVTSNKNVNEFYDVKDKLTKINNSDEATAGTILGEKYLNSMNGYIGELYKEKREIELLNISDKEKYEKVRNKQKEINTLTQKSLENYTNVNEKDGIGEISGQYYRIDKE